MRVDDFDFHLPDELIAKAPLPERDASRLLVIPRGDGPLQHRRFLDLPELLRAGDLLVLNDTRVIPARLKGVKEASAGKVELLLCEPLPPAGDRAAFKCLGQASKPIREGARLRFGDVHAEVLAVRGDGFYDVAFDAAPSAMPELIERLGELPLPPYLGRDPVPADRERYQTVYARVAGSVAAPTAGLHFTDRVFAALDARGVRRASVTLHVGPGTFLPVRVDHVAEHKMHGEVYFVPEATARAIEETRARGGRVIAVGTTSLRTLEAAADGKGGVRPGDGNTELFVVPGFPFRVIDGLVTNFHLPKSTLVMLVAALVGRERILAAYAEAVRERYRFFSYGDATLVLP